MSRRGWFKESYRHYLASKGVSTRRYMAKPSWSSPDTGFERLLRGGFEKYDDRRKRALEDTSADVRAAALQRAFWTRPEKDVYGESQFSPDELKRIQTYKEFLGRELTSAETEYAVGAATLAQRIDDNEQARLESVMRVNALVMKQRELNNRSVLGEDVFKELRDVDASLTQERNYQQTLTDRTDSYRDLYDRFSQGVLNENEKQQLRRLASDRRTRQVARALQEGEVKSQTGAVVAEGAKELKSLKELRERLDEINKVMPAVESRIGELGAKGSSLSGDERAELARLRSSLSGLQGTLKEGKEMLQAVRSGEMPAKSIIGDLKPGEQRFIVGVQSKETQTTLDKPKGLFGKGGS